jgi:hypothetical protein
MAREFLHLIQGYQLQSPKEYEAFTVIDSFLKELEKTINSLQGRVLAYSRVYNTGNINIPNGGGLTALTFNATREQVDLIHDNTINPTRLKIPRPGNYSFGACVAYDISATGVRQLGVQLTRNGVASLILNNVVPSAGAGVYTVMAIHGEMYLYEQDFLEVVTYQSSGGVLPILRIANYSAEAWVNLLS